MGLARAALDDHAAVRAAGTDLDATVVDNPDYADGQSMSVRRGVRDAVLVALGDMPSVSVSTVGLVVGAYERGVADVVAAGYDGRRGNPVLFDARYVDDLTDVDGDVGGRHLLRESGVAVVVETGDPASFATWTTRPRRRRLTDGHRVVQSSSDSSVRAACWSVASACQSSGASSR